jgi:hypothetical protein
LSERDDALSRFSLDKSEFTLQMNKILEDKERFITAQAAEHREATADLELQLNARTEELFTSKKSKVLLEDKLKSVDGEYKAKFFESQSEISALRENLKAKSEELLEKENYSNNLSRDMTSKIRELEDGSRKGHKADEQILDSLRSQLKSKTQEQKLKSDEDEKIIAALENKQSRLKQKIQDLTQDLSTKQAEFTKTLSKKSVESN